MPANVSLKRDVGIVAERRETSLGHTSRKWSRSIPCRVARLLVKQHGYEKALSVAAERAADLACKGASSGVRWFQGTRGVHPRMEPGARQRVN